MNQLYEKLAEVLDVDAVRPTDELGSFESWDSLAILTLIVTLESSYGVRFTGADFRDLRTAEDIEKAIMAKQART